MTTAQKKKTSVTTKRKEETKLLNTFRLRFNARSVNESFARVAVTSFVSQLNPTVNELSELKTAVSEAVTNSIVHAYKDKDRSECYVWMSGECYDNGRIVIVIKDRGCGIDNIEKAVEPLYTTDSDNERSGMGFTVMSTFTDKLRVTSTVMKGTTVTLEKYITI